MSLIKADNLAAAVSVRSLETARKVVASRRPEPFVDPEILALRREVEVLRRDLEQREAAIARHKSELEQASREGEARGREAGRREVEDNQASRLAALRQGVEQALLRYGEELASLERLAPLVAAAGLDRIIGSAPAQAKLLAKAVRRQIESLDGQALMRIEVSAADFADPAALADLPVAVGRPEVEVRAVEDLEAGGCRIKLALGALEVGIGQQWSRLRGALENMSEPDAAS